MTWPMALLRALRVSVSTAAFLFSVTDMRSFDH